MCSELTVFSIVLLIMFIFGGLAGVSKYLVTDALITRRHLVMTAAVHGTSGMSAAFFLGAAFFYFGYEESISMLILSSIGLSILIARIGNDKLTTIVIAAVNKFFHLDLDDRDDDLVEVKQYLDSLTKAEILTALHDALERKREIAAYERQQAAGYAGDE